MNVVHRCIRTPNIVLRALSEREAYQCNIEENNKHRIGWLKVDERSIRMEIVVYKS